MQHFDRIIIGFRTRQNGLNYIYTSANEHDSFCNKHRQKIKFFRFERTF